MTLLNVDDMKVTYETADSKVHAVNGVSFDVEHGSNYGLVGESGSGKSTIAQAILGLLPDNGTVEAGSLEFKGEDITQMSETERRNLLWEEIAYIPQSAMDALDPVMTTGDQIKQAITKHRKVSDAKAEDRVKELFELVELDPSRIDEYPHEFSGGMRQRVTIAMALALDPSLIIADEPTTGLDVIVQDKIVHKINEIQEEIDASLLLVTHDIGVIAETCEELSVLYGGKVMEQGNVGNILTNPTNPYTMGLKSSFPELDDTNNTPVAIPGSPPDLNAEPTGCTFKDRCPFAEQECEESVPPLEEIPNRNQRSACHFVNKAAAMREEATDPETWGIQQNPGKKDIGRPVLEVDNLEKHYELKQGIIEGLKQTPPDTVKAVDGVSFSVNESEIFGIAGESGCGKSTLGETIALLEEPTGGQMRFDGRDVDEYQKDIQSFRKQVQIIFQDPFDSLNPRLTVRQLVEEPLTIHNYDPDDREQKVEDTLERVGLEPASKFLSQYPHELSGGQRQRVAIARALILEPKLLVCDEPASMLDVSLKVNLLNLFRELSEKEDISIIYISHDLASLAHVSDRLAIMYLGRFMEIGETDRLVSNPKHPYTSSLLEASPEKDPSITRERVLLDGEPPDPIDLSSGCKFAERCPKAQPECFDAEPDLDQTGKEEQSVACYFPVEGERLHSELKQEL
ncbi:peptide/nickel transport system ATP-binding protein [Halogranum gelatinilyticum]|uniref:Peptide/nickel transport system ATP-binding protein n=1 Tax=Halogranum gelatinilyticum TaxID=660521 RepID=A0A1G9Z168_9EURY|nr:ABC transporter ATP-binding protein [Halogranum gelatinilyticum]SDN14376.1 peptide/nickel transport system ATP-binding protein [Halogranum gelatinilyticum]